MWCHLVEFILRFYFLLHLMCCPKIQNVLVNKISKLHLNELKMENVVIKLVSIKMFQYEKIYVKTGYYLYVRSKSTEKKYLSDA